VLTGKMTVEQLRSPVLDTSTGVDTVSVLKVTSSGELSKLQESTQMLIESALAV
jgi:hypothetical protein